VIAAVLALALAQGDPGFERVAALLGERRLGEAYALLASVEDPALAARAEADLWYFARDFGASLAAAERGLSAAPDDLFLLHRAVSAALWIRDERRATLYAAQLRSALAAAQLADEERAWWTGACDDLSASAGELAAAAEERDRLRRRARAAALGLLGGSVLALGALARLPSGHG
jgi:hypothetical protein